MKNLNLILLIVIILIQFIHIELTYAQDAAPSSIIETIQVPEPTPPPAPDAPDAPAHDSPTITKEEAEAEDEREHKREDEEAKEHMIILVCGILGGCVGTAALIFTAWFIFRKLKAKERNDNTKEAVEDDDREPDSFMLTIPGSDEYRTSQRQTLSQRRSNDEFSGNIYTQAASPPQPKGNVNFDNIDSNVIQHIKQELLKDLNKQGGDYANIPVGIPIYDTSNSASRQKEELDIVQQIKQEVLRDLDIPNQNRDSTVASETNMPSGVDKDVVNRLKEEALQDIKNELKEKLRKEMSLSNKRETYDLT